jgi:hypothetical protein
MFIQTNGLAVNDGSAVLNGRGIGLMGEQLQGVHFDAGLLRPFFDKNGVQSVMMRTGRMVKNAAGRLVAEHRKVPIHELTRRGISSPVMNSTSLRKDEWIELDRQVLMAARQRLRAWEDLSTANTFGGFDGMSKITLEHEAMSDPGEAVVDMDGLSDGRTDSPLFKLRSIPLPITHSDFWFSARRLAVSRNSGTPLDTVMAEAAGRRVAEMIEKTLIGVETGIAFGPTSTSDTRYDNDSQVYGYTNLPERLTKTDLNTPTGSNPEAVKQDVIEMREALYANGFYGPFMLYHTPAYDAFFDDDYFRTGSTAIQQTLRERIKGIEGIQDVRRLDYWTGSDYQMVLVQMTSDVARAINGMDITTVQWESQGGMRLNFKVMAIQVPQLRYDFSGNCGIIHATTA